MNDELRAAAERIVNAPTIWFGEPSGPGSVDIQYEDAIAVARACLASDHDLLIKLRDAAEFVASELIAYIDMDQDFEGWAHSYRGHFKLEHARFRTLGDAMNELRDRIAEVKL